MAVNKFDQDDQDNQAKVEFEAAAAAQRMEAQHSEEAGLTGTEMEKKAGLLVKKIEASFQNISEQGEAGNLIRDMERLKEEQRRLEGQRNAPLEVLQPTDAEKKALQDVFAKLVAAFGEVQGIRELIEKNTDLATMEAKMGVVRKLLPQLQQKAEYQLQLLTELEQGDGTRHSGWVKGRIVDLKAEILELNTEAKALLAELNERKKEWMEGVRAIKLEELNDRSAEGIKKNNKNLRLFPALTTYAKKYLELQPEGVKAAFKEPLELFELNPGVQNDENVQKNPEGYAFQLSVKLSATTKALDELTAILNNNGLDDSGKYAAFKKFFGADVMYWSQNITASDAVRVKEMETKLKKTLTFVCELLETQLSYVRSFVTKRISDQVSPLGEKDGFVKDDEYFEKERLVREKNQRGKTLTEELKQRETDVKPGGKHYTKLIKLYGTVASELGEPVKNVVPAVVPEMTELLRGMVRVLEDEKTDKTPDKRATGIDSPLAIECLPQNFRRVLNQVKDHKGAQGLEVDPNMVLTWGDAVVRLIEARKHGDTLRGKLAAAEGKMMYIEKTVVNALIDYRKAQKQAEVEQKDEQKDTLIEDSVRERSSIIKLSEEAEALMFTTLRGIREEAQTYFQTVSNYAAGIAASQAAFHAQVIQALPTEEAKALLGLSSDSGKDAKKFDLVLSQGNSNALAVTGSDVVLDWSNREAMEKKLAALKESRKKDASEAAEQLALSTVQTFEKLRILERNFIQGSLKRSADAQNKLRIQFAAIQGVCSREIKEIDSKRDQIKGARNMLLAAEREYTRLLAFKGSQEEEAAVFAEMYGEKEVRKEGKTHLEAAPSENPVYMALVQIRHYRDTVAQLETARKNIGAGVDDKAKARLADINAQVKKLQEKIAEIEETLETETVPEGRRIAEQKVNRDYHKHLSKALRALEEQKTALALNELDLEMREERFRLAVTVLQRIGHPYNSARLIHEISSQLALAPIGNREELRRFIKGVKDPSMVPLRAKVIETPNFEEAEAVWEKMNKGGFEQVFGQDKEDLYDRDVFKDTDKSGKESESEAPVAATPFSFMKDLDAGSIPKTDLTRELGESNGGLPEAESDEAAAAEPSEPTPAVSEADAEVELEWEDPEE